MLPTTTFPTLLAVTMMATVVASVPVTTFLNHSFLMEHTLWAESPFSMFQSNWTDQRRSSDRVSVILYTESLCPGCQSYILEQVIPAYPELASIMNLAFVPFGNAEFEKLESGNYKIDCQHGPRECLANIWENCVKMLSGIENGKSWLPFTKCFLEKLRDNNKTDVHQLGKECAKKVQYFNPKALEECATGAQGFIVHIIAGLFTKSLSTQLLGVPTLYINGKEAPESSLDDFARTVCEAYRGNDVPKLCQKYQ